MHGTPVVVVGDAVGTTHRRPRSAVVGVLAALLLTSLDHTIINVALPQMVREVGATSSDLQWIADAYVVVFAGLLLVGGALGDRYGRRLALLAGLTIFGAGSAVAALASTADAVIAGRAVMGIGGGLIMPATLSSLIAMFDGERRVKAISAWTATASVGVALGPLVGGWLLSWSSWNAVFWINVPVALVAAAALVAGLGENRAARATRPDLVGGALSMVAVGSLVWAVIEAPVDGWLSSPSLLRILGAVVAVAAFLVWLRMAPAPMLDIATIRAARIGGASAAITIAFVALGGAMFLIAQYLQFSLGYSPLTAGAALLPAAAGLGIGSHLSSRHHGGTVGAAAGIGTLVAGWGLVVQAVHGDGTAYLPTGIGMFLLGLGLGVAVPAATATIVGRMPGAQAGVASDQRHRSGARQCTRHRRVRQPRRRPLQRPRGGGDPGERPARGHARDRHGRHRWRTRRVGDAGRSRRGRRRRRSAGLPRRHDRRPVVGRGTHGDQCRRRPRRRPPSERPSRERAPRAQRNGAAVAVTAFALAGVVVAIELTRSHLRHEAARFRRGDFGDPQTIHGVEMPRLAELREHGGRRPIRHRTPTAGQS